MADALIVKTPGTCAGLPRIDGTRITVKLIVQEMRGGWKPADIVLAHPHLTLAQVEAALAYYHDHRDEIDASLIEADAKVAELKSTFPSKLAAARLAQSK